MPFTNQHRTLPKDDAKVRGLADARFARNQTRYDST
jgi:hypothetical protein